MWYVYIVLMKLICRTAHICQIIYPISYIFFFFVVSFSESSAEKDNSKGKLSVYLWYYYDEGSNFLLPVPKQNKWMVWT